MQVFTLFRAFLFAYGGICAATVLHEKLLHAILGATVSFFDVTPVSRPVNNFFASDQLIFLHLFIDWQNSEPVLIRCCKFEQFFRFFFFFFFFLRFTCSF